MTDDMVKALRRIKPVNSLKEVQHFIGFANFYRKFIKGYSKICLLLTNSNSLSKTDWRQTPDILTAQKSLVQAFTTAPILKHFDPAIQAIVETDASDFTLGAILSQKHGKYLHPVAFHSRKFSPAEINYDVCNKELLAIVDYFKRWQRYLEGARHQVQVITDHNNLELFMTTKILNRRQARWAQELAGYDFRIYFRPGHQNAKANYLSRCPEHRLKEGEDGKQELILKPENLPTACDHLRFIGSGSRITSIPTAKWSEKFLQDIRSAVKKDEQYQQGLEALGSEQERRDNHFLAIQDGLLYRKSRLYVPRGLRESILESEHDSKVAGHFGQDKTLELIGRNFWWPGMKAQIIGYIQSCPTCQHDKARRHRRYGLLSPLELPHAPWESLSMDFITGLPFSEGCDELWVIIDRFSKMAHFIPLVVGSKTAAHLAKVFAREIWRLHGLPQDIISDRDSRFTSAIWQVFIAILGIWPRMSTAFHPQTDGQTERLNQVIEAYLRPFLSQEQDDWVDLLPMAEFAYNNSTASSTDLTPFYTNYGWHPSANNPRSTEALHPASRAYTHWIQGTIECARHALQNTRTQMAKYADRSRSEAPRYKKNGPVMLSKRNLKIKRPSKKLDHKFIGPFQVEKVVSPSAIRLTLPQGWRTHPTFHMSELEPFISGSRPTPDCEKILRQVSDLETEEEYDVKAIMGSIIRKRRILYHVKWLGYPKKKDSTYEPYENFSKDAREKLLEFHTRTPAVPRDHRLRNPAQSSGADHLQARKRRRPTPHGTTSRRPEWPVSDRLDGNTRSRPEWLASD